MKALRLELEAKEQKAVGIIKEIPRFSFEAFERKFVICADDRLNVFAAYRHTIQSLYKEDRVGNASSYECSQKSFQSFVKRNTLSFESITVDFLKAYEKWMLQDGNSLTTVGIYVRPLRALFNQAVREGIVALESYPFGKGRYQIPAGRNVKKALSLIDIEKIFKHPVQEGSTEQWARDL